MSPVPCPKLTCAAAAAAVLAMVASAAIVGAASGPAGRPDPSRSVISGSALVDTKAAVPRVGHPAIFLSWDAPWGMPRASAAATATCDDSTAADTLYLSFDPGEDIGQLMGINATLTFRAAAGDTLGPFWDLSRAGANPWNLRIEFDEPPEGAEAPWPVAGDGGVRYTLSRESGRLDLSYAVPASRAGPIAAGTRYFFARVFLWLRKARLAGCRQPVCVELNHMVISHGGSSRWVNQGERFVSWNSPGGAACKEHRLRPPAEEPPRFGGAPSAPATRDTTRR